MRSATSFFDKTLFRSQLKHTWPLWLGYTALWLFLVPVALFSELSAYQGSYSAADASSLLLNAGVRGGVFISFVFGLFFAMLSFSHLTQSRATNGFHALPVRRETIFLTAYLTGLFCQLSSILVTLHDGTWEYSFGRDHTPVFDAPASGVTEDMLRETLDNFGFSVPADATFTLLPYGSSYRAVFSADLLPTEGGFLHGTLTCDLRTQGDGQSTLPRLENRITTLAPVREEPILSPAQALAALQSGKSFEGAWFAQSVQQIEVRSCTLDYLSDSKGFYQPVYRFELSLAGQAGGITDAVDYVPALF